MSPQEFGAQIRQRRHEHHLSIAQLAALIAISPLSLRNMERGEFEPLDNQAIEAIDEVLDSSPNDRLAFPGFEQFIPSFDDAWEAFEQANDLVKTGIIVLFPATADLTCHLSLKC